MDVFACQHCDAVPEPVVDGNAKVSVVRHAPGWTPKKTDKLRPLPLLHASDT